MIIKNEYDYKNHQVAISPNCFDESWNVSSLKKVFLISRNTKHIDKCKKVANLLYYVDPDNSRGDQDDYLLLIENEKVESKKFRRKNIPMVKYNIQSNNHALNNYIVILDIDFKVELDELDHIKLDSLKNEVISFYDKQSFTVFLIESTSGLGFHLGMALYTDSMNKNVYQKAFEIFSNELASFSETNDFTKYIDSTVSRLEASFFIGPNISPTSRFKNPTHSLSLNKDKLPETTYNSTYHSSIHNDFILTHFSKLISPNCKVFSDYENWSKMLIAIVVIFRDNKKRAKFWFDYFSKFCCNRTNQSENLEHFERAFSAQFDQQIGVNYIIKKVIGGKFRNKEIKYKISDVKDYIESLGSDSYLTSDTETIKIDNYISEQSHLINSDQNLLVSAPPNSGKTHYFMSIDKVIFLTPTSILRDDLHSSMPHAYKITNDSKKPINIIDPNQEKYIGNYDAIFRITISDIELSKFTLVIDESHELFMSAHPDFRHRVLRKLTDSLTIFKNFVLLTGTPFPFIHPFNKFKTLTFSKKTPQVPTLYVNETSTPLSSLVDDVIGTDGKQIIYLNDKNKIENVRELLTKEDSTRPIRVFTSETKLGSQQQEILTTNKLPENTILLATQMILEGISLQDEEIVALRFYQPILPEYIAQFSFRPRKTKEIKIHMYVKPKEYVVAPNAILSTAYNWCLTKTEYDIQNCYKYNTNDESYYTRYFIGDLKGENKLLPIVKVYDEIEIDYLFLGQIACEKALRAQSVDLMAVLVQLKKWHFQFVFIKKNNSDTLKVNGRLNLNEQREIIKTSFERIMTKLEVKKNQKFLKRAWDLCQFFNHKYLGEMNPEERLLYITNTDKFKQLLVIIGVFAVKKNIENSILNHLVKEFEIEKSIKIISEVQNMVGYPTIKNEDLNNAFSAKDFGIKKINKTLKIYFEVEKINTDRKRSVKLCCEHINDLEYNILIEKFKQKVSNLS